MVGAGVAGLTLAAKLCQQGRPPVVVERDAEGGDDGYAISLYPMGGDVLHGLGCHDELEACSLVTERYELRDGRDRTLQAMDLSELTDRVGPMRTVARRDLLRVLRGSCTDADLRRGATVQRWHRAGERIVVRLDDGSEEEVDLLVGADGIASSIRRRSQPDAAGYDSGWALWTWWADESVAPPELVREWWGDRWMFGTYPAPGRVMCAAGGPADVVSADADARRSLGDLLAPLVERSPTVAAAVGRVDRPYRWVMRDVRARSWSSGRIALCGDAAAGFLPTAGVGASCALGGAAGLADELSRAGAATVPVALDRYERRCRPWVEANQAESRRLARVMFLSRPGLTGLRDVLARLVPGSMMLRQIVRSSTRPL